MNTITKTKTKTGMFPKLSVEMLLRDELIMAVEVEAKMHGNTLPMSPAAALIAPVPMDSLVVVDLLCAVEPILGFAPSDATVRTGGYHSVQDAMNQLMPILEKQWHKKQGVLK